MYFKIFFLNDKERTFIEAETYLRGQILNLKPHYLQTKKHCQ